MRPMLLLLVVSSTLLTSCSLLDDDDGPAAPPGQRSIVGTIEFYGDDPQIEAPARVRANESFTVTVHTFGNGCFSKGPTEVNVDNNTATITPLDFVPAAYPNVICTEQLVILAHRATLQFARPGTARIRILGRRQDVDNPQGTSIILNRTLQVE